MWVYDILIHMDTRQSNYVGNDILIHVDTRYPYLRGYLYDIFINLVI